MYMYMYVSHVMVTSDHDVIIWSSNLSFIKKKRNQNLNKKLYAIWLPSFLIIGLIILK